MAFVEAFNGSLRNELLNAELFDTLDGARRKLAQVSGERMLAMAATTQMV
ncbi:hypothetical protein HW561_20920 [Rhodobacteraceae bacterium B1Z28]|uniref:Integrase-like protein n=1 Tax=Ruegeria haliotis TaxID=2747601 RepID=A0ABX2PXJ1_9RHOB|nr:hypothetical protein [Ruegeria haliotis]